jgi:hypothetical protein
MVIAIKTHKILYMALPKAACSSVKAALSQMDEFRHEDVDPADADRWHQMYPTMRFRPHRFKAYTRAWFRFCVVRDPLKRLFSCYVDRVVERGELRNSRRIKDGRYDLPVLPDPDFFFQNLDRYIRAASVIKHHALPAQLFLGPDLSVYDRVYPVSRLPGLAHDLSRRSGKIITMPRENRTGQRLDLDDLSPQTRDALRKRLAPEYAFLSQYFDSPFAPLSACRLRAGA